MSFLYETLYVAAVLVLVGPALRNYFTSYFIPFVGLVLGNYPPVEMRSIQVKAFSLDRLKRKPLAGAANAGIVVAFIWMMTIFLGVDLTIPTQSILLALILLASLLHLTTGSAYRAVMRRMPRPAP